MDAQLVWLFHDFQEQYKIIKKKRCYKEHFYSDIQTLVNSALICFLLCIDKAGRRSRDWNWLRLGFLNEFFHLDYGRSDYRDYLSQGVFAERFKTEPPEIYRVIVQAANDSIFTVKEDCPIYPLQLFKIYQYLGKAYLSIDPSSTTEDEVDRYLSYLDMLEQYHRRHLSKKLLAVYDQAQQAIHQSPNASVVDERIGKMVDDRELLVFQVLRKYSDDIIQENIEKEKKLEEKECEAFQKKKLQLHKQLDWLERLAKEEKENRQEREDAFKVFRENTNQKIQEKKCELKAVREELTATRQDVKDARDELQNIKKEIAKYIEERDQAREDEWRSKQEASHEEHPREKTDTKEIENGASFLQINSEVIEEIQVPLNSMSLSDDSMEVREVFDYGMIRYLLGHITNDSTEYTDRQEQIIDYYLKDHQDVYKGNIGTLKDDEDADALIDTLFSCFCQFDDACCALRISCNYSELLREYFLEQGESFLAAGDSSKAMIRSGQRRIRKFLKTFDDYVAEKRKIGPLRLELLDKYHSKEEKNQPSSPNAVSVPQGDISKLMEELDNLIGLEGVKQQVRSLINLVKIRKVREQQGLNNVPMSLHLVFSGNPGTGKTTVARLLAKIYKELGILSLGTFIEVDRSGLVGGYVGQTALKVQKVIQESLGGILFIDEAYSLTVHRGEDDYGKEAVDTLLKGMEDHRDDLIVIVAGYTNEMKEFLQSNPGLQSRFNTFIEFSDYTVDELFQMFQLLCKKNHYICDEQASQYVKSYLCDACAQKKENFSNGRFVRNYFEKVLLHQANRLSADDSLDKSELLTIVYDDVATEMDK